jgi:aspartokinase/homoserine dehydrogenase 1
VSWVVHKFGGTSLAEAGRYRAVAKILDDQAPLRRAVVVSAMAGTTDALIDLVERASSRDEGWLEACDALRARQIAVIEELLPAGAREPLVDLLRSDIEDIRVVLRALWLMQAPPQGAVDVVSGYGEVWSARLLAGHLRVCDQDAVWLDAREVLVVESGEPAPVVDWETSKNRLSAWLRNRENRTVVVTGYVATDAAGAPTTLGRNGSDYSASIFASLLAAGEIDIWTDVDGVLTADPRLVPEAQVLGELSYDEAMELAYFGARVIHPATMGPAVEQQIPIYIRNTFRPQAPGTRIHLRSAAVSGGDRETRLPVKGFATIDEMVLFNLEGSGMVGVPGIAERLFSALREAGVSVVLISQGSSEHSICFAVPAAQTAAARQAVDRAFAFELQHDRIQRLDVVPDCTILAVVGDTMSGTPGVAATFFGALGRAGVNVRAIAQGSSERNISVVIDGKDSTRGLRAAHAGFYLSHQALSIGLIGHGLVGAALLRQLARRLDGLRREFNVDLRLLAIAGSRRMLLAQTPIALESWRERLDADGEPVDIGRLATHVKSDAAPHALLIDCTADEAVAGRYVEWLDHGLHVITPNKKAGTSSLAAWRRLRRAVQGSRRHYLYETTVGAALPILQTLRDLIRTGDEVLGIEGVLSGTLSYLFNSFDGSRPFSEIVREARERGYTEPDPREDLNGMDVARKVVILAREMGLELELDDLDVKSLVPEELRGIPADQFLADLGALDAPMQQLFEVARSRNEVLRFVGTIDPGGGSQVDLRGYPATHPFARIRLTDNIVLFRTRRYDENPLVVQGPGAGPEVTAGGVFADILRLAANLGATL